MKFYEETLNENLIYKGDYLNIYRTSVKLPNDETADRDIIKHPGACGIVAFIDSDNIILVEQFRKPLDKTILEIPAGKLDKGEDIAVCAKRELQEETGYVAGKIQFLGSIAPAPGFCDEILHLFKATDLTLGAKDCDEDEFTEIKVISLEKLKEMIKCGEIIDAKTIASLAYL